VSIDYAGPEREQKLGHFGGNSTDQYKGEEQSAGNPSNGREMVFVYRKIPGLLSFFISWSASGLKSASFAKASEFFSVGMIVSSLLVLAAKLGTYPSAFLRDSKEPC